MQERKNEMRPVQTLLSQGEIINVSFAPLFFVNGENVKREK